MTKMIIEKVQETYVISEEETESKVTLDIRFRILDYEILRTSVKAGSLVVEKAIDLAVEILKKKVNVQKDESAPK